jgi:co-chaperonin GroES (HSP10)
MKPAFSPTVISEIRALRDSVLVKDMEFKGRQLSSGIILPSDNGKADGIRPRWGQVYAIGPEQKHVRIGQWICVAHGRWTRGLDIQDDEGVKTIRRVDPNDILLVSDEHPGNDDTISSAVSGQ